MVTTYTIISLYTSIIAVPMTSTENRVSMRWRALRPIVSSSADERATKRVMALANGVAPTSIQVPLVVASSCSQGVVLVVMTGVPDASASAMVSPKFSVNDGCTTKSASRSNCHLRSPYAPPI